MLTSSRLVVAVTDRILIYGVSDPFELTLLHNIETFENPKGTVKQPRDSNFEGLFALCCHAAAPLVAVPGRQVGHIHVVDFRHDDRLSSTMIVAHRHALAKIAISRGGDLVASTSDEGTLVRIFDVATRQQLHEFRRGYVTWPCIHMTHPTPAIAFCLFPPLELDASCHAQLYCLLCYSLSPSPQQTCGSLSHAWRK